ncbi:MAG: FMN-binding protein, partial [Fusobacteriaceae bacterium]
KNNLLKLTTIFMISFSVVFGEVKEYTGAGKGFSGEIQVKVSFEENKIINIEVIKNPESRFTKSTFKKIIKNVLDTQSVEVDDIAGATYTSTGLKDAIKKAVTESKVTLVQVDKIK